MKNALLLGETRRSAQRIGDLFSPDFFNAIARLPLLIALLENEE